MIDLKTLWEDNEDEAGCAFILDEGDVRQICGAPRRRSSAYCPEHHAFCHVPAGSTAENHRLREVEALAKAVGGRHGRESSGPSRGFLKRLERAARFSLG
jgi:hypothetical protein